MNVFYAFGGGFGHLTRIKSFIDDHVKDDYILLTNNVAGRRFFSKEKLDIMPGTVPFERVHVQKWVELRIQQYQPDNIYIDTFPVGMLGELTPDMLKNIGVHLTCRRLKWDVYLPLVQKTLYYEKAFIYEPLEPDHEQYVQTNSREIVPMALALREPTLTPPLLANFGKPVWLVVHTSSAEEVALLMDYACDVAKAENADPTLVVITDQTVHLDQGILLHHEDPINWYPHADRIFTAAGFNSWYQLAPWRHKHRAIPLPRKFDDQFWRSTLK